MIELQGELESRNMGSLAGKLVGDLHYTKDVSIRTVLLFIVTTFVFEKLKCSSDLFSFQNIPLLIIGHHILHGKVQKLEKPFAVIDKVASSSEGSVSEYQVQAIIKKKISFTERPKPIVTTVKK